MKRDMNLCRKILLFAESLPQGPGAVELTFPGYSHDAIEYNALLLVDGGFLKQREGIFLGADEVGVYPDGITFAGHDFLDAARDDTIWRKAMDRAGSASFEIIKAVLESYVKQTLGLSA